MEKIAGRRTIHIDSAALSAWRAAYAQIVIDIGTGDGRYVQQLAQAYPTYGVIGIDTCRENLRTASRQAPANALFLIANALALPTEIHGLATKIMVNFPWGSLVHGLLDADGVVLRALGALAQPSTTLELRLNGDALASSGWALEEGGERIRQQLHATGWRVGTPQHMCIRELRTYPSTWARRLAFGRDPRTLLIHAVRPTAVPTSQRSTERKTLIAAC